MNFEAIPTVSTELGITDRLGHWRVRWAVGRKRYRVKPGLYQVGKPDSRSPVLVTANYKLTFDVLRFNLEGVDAWILVLDTKGVNVWCAAGKGTFGSDELVRKVRDTNLESIVSHRKLVLPQLGATGVAAHQVQQRCGFKVVYGPIRAADLKLYLERGMRATTNMRRVLFPLAERLKLVGAEVGPMLKWLVLLILIGCFFVAGESIFERLQSVFLIALPILVGFVAGTVLVPILMPWIPGRAFSFKGALLGAIAVGGIIALTPSASTLLGKVQMFLFGTTIASFFAMQFTGATTFTSPSGVEWEMKRALVFQVAAVLLASGIGVMRLVF